MAKKRIYIAYTGGTIGMQRSERGYIPVPGFMASCLAGMPEFHRAEMPEYEIHEYTPLIDSSNMTPADTGNALPMTFWPITTPMMVLWCCMVPIPCHSPPRRSPLCWRTWANR